MVLITTSWDDGHTQDGRLVELLSRHQIKATLYVPASNPERPVMSVREIADLSKVPGIEIGSHSMSHIPLTGMPRTAVQRELVDSRHWLEQTIGQAVSSFCFPQGKHRKWMRHLVAQAGYLVGRTTESHHFRLQYMDPLLMPTTLQVHPHGRVMYLRHAAKEANIRGAWQVPAIGPTNDVTRAIVRAATLAEASQGFVHLWGHSWEIEDKFGWQRLERLFELLGSIPNARFVTNAELADSLPPKPSQGAGTS